MVAPSTFRHEYLTPTTIAPAVTAIAAAGYSSSDSHPKIIAAAVAAIMMAATYLNRRCVAETYGVTY